MKRYRIRSHEGYSHLEVDERSNGEWIKHDDLPAITDQAKQEERERQAGRWEQALDFCLGSVGEYGEGSPKGEAYRSAYIFIRRLAALEQEANDAE